MGSKKYSIYIHQCLGTLCLSFVLIIWGACSPFSYPGQEEVTLTNALYLAHRWVDTLPDTEELKKLEEELRSIYVDTVFVHVGPLDPDGTIPEERSPYRELFVKEFTKYVKDVDVQAWIGQREVRGGGSLDIRKPEVRKKIVETAEEYIAIGFTGIHINIEPMIVEDDSLEILLKDVKHSIGENKLSIALTPVEPITGIHVLSKLWRDGRGMFLTPAEYARLSRHVDQVMIMAYDTGLQEPLLYTTFVSLVTERMLRLSDPSTEVFIGIPTYEDKRVNFNPEVENIQSAVLGVLTALQGRSSHESIRGLGIYAHWTIDAQEWEQLKALLEY